MTGQEVNDRSCLREQLYSVHSKLLGQMQGQAQLLSPSGTYWTVRLALRDQIEPAKRDLTAKIIDSLTN